MQPSGGRLVGRSKGQPLFTGPRGHARMQQCVGGAAAILGARETGTTGATPTPRGNVFPRTAGHARARSRSALHNAFHPSMKGARSGGGTSLARSKRSETGGATQTTRRHCWQSHSACLTSHQSPTTHEPTPRIFGDTGGKHGPLDHVPAPAHGLSQGPRGRRGCSAKAPHSLKGNGASAGAAGAARE